jgi:queuine/archaeosine tRNA-ribosyltransferase
MEAAEAGFAQTVQPEDIEEAYRETESWMERVSQAKEAELQQAIVANLQQDTEPHLLRYVISELNEPLEDRSELNDEEKGEVFFVLKTVISSFRTKSKGKIIEIE